MSKVLLLGFESPLREELIGVLAGLRFSIDTQNFQDDWLAHAEAQVVFCSGDNPHFRDAIRAARRHRPGLPMVVVTRLPEVSAWLDALEAGATDYCAAPFEPVQMRWVLDTAMPRPARAAA
jgi:DNA-binding NtrC family response regulator